MLALWLYVYRVRHAIFMYIIRNENVQTEKFAATTKILTNVDCGKYHDSVYCIPSCVYIYNRSTRNDKQIT